jgi:hypothetical protein
MLLVDLAERFLKDLKLQDQISAAEWKRFRTESDDAGTCSDAEEIAEAIHTPVISRRKQKSGSWIGRRSSLAAGSIRLAYENWQG